MTTLDRASLLEPGPTFRSAGPAVTRRRRATVAVVPDVPASPPKALCRPAPRPRSGLRFFHGDALDTWPGSPLHPFDAIVTSPPYNLGIRYRSLRRRRCRGREYLEWTGEWVAGRRRVLAARRLAVPERRRQADRSLDRARRRAGGAAAPRAPEHHPLDQVDRDRIATRRRARPDLDRRPGGRPLQADQQRPVSERLPRVRLPLHAARADAARPPRGRRAVSGPVERRALADTPAPACAAAATPGSSPTRRFRAATRTGRTRRRSRRGCPRCASGCTAWRAFGLVARSVPGARAAPPSRARGWGVTSSASRSTSYLEEAIDRTRAACA